MKNQCTEIIPLKTTNKERKKQTNKQSEQCHNNLAFFFYVHGTVDTTVHTDTQPTPNPDSSYT